MDGNKRTGATAAVISLLRNEYRLTANNADLMAVSMSFAQSQASLAE